MLSSSTSCILSPTDPVRLNIYFEDADINNNHTFVWEIRKVAGDPDPDFEGSGNSYSVENFPSGDYYVLLTINDTHGGQASLAAESCNTIETKKHVQ